MKDLDRTFREYALRAISDDYEEFEKILQDVTGWAAACGVTPDRSSTLRALEELIRDGYAQAYILSAVPPGKAEAVSYSLDRLDELWFYVTPKGKRLARQLHKEWSG
jgi:hypothetical protein